MNEMANKQNRAEELAEAHWGYIEGLLNSHDIEDEIIVACRYHYKTAFVHGYKHALEDIESEKRILSECGGLGDK